MTQKDIEDRIMQVDQQLTAIGNQLLQQNPTARELNGNRTVLVEWLDALKIEEAAKQADGSSTEDTV